MDITKLVKPGVFLPRPGHDDLWIGFKFEKLPKCCFNCGLLGHLAKDCNLHPFSLSNQFGVRFPAYGNWLYADNAHKPPRIYERLGASPEFVDNSQVVEGDRELEVATKILSPMMTSTRPNLSDSANVGLSSTSLKDTNILASDLNVGGAHEALAASEFQIREG